MPTADLFSLAFESVSVGTFASSIGNHERREVRRVHPVEFRTLAERAIVRVAIRIAVQRKRQNARP